jgi:hypothetical protein
VLYVGIALFALVAAPVRELARASPEPVSSAAA